MLVYGYREYGQDLRTKCAEGIKAKRRHGLADHTSAMIRPGSTLQWHGRCSMVRSRTDSYI